MEPNVRSGQLRQALGALSSALNSDNYNSVIANIGQDLNANDGRINFSLSAAVINITLRCFFFIIIIAVCVM